MQYAIEFNFEDKYLKLMNLDENIIKIYHYDNIRPYYKSLPSRGQLFAYAYDEEYKEYITVYILEKDNKVYISIISCDDTNIIDEEVIELTLRKINHNQSQEKTHNSD